MRLHILAIATLLLCADCTASRNGASRNDVDIPAQPMEQALRQWTHLFPERQQFLYRESDNLQMVTSHPVHGKYDATETLCHLFQGTGLMFLVFPKMRPPGYAFGLKGAWTNSKADDYILDSVACAR